MGMKPKPSNIDSSIASPVDFKRCQECCALLPTSHYGIAKWRKDGYRPVCKECRSQINVLDWTQKHGRKHPHTAPEILRPIRFQNDMILNQALSTLKMELRAFDVVTKVEYKVYYGPTDRLGLMALTLFTRSGDTFMEWALSGVRDPKASLLAYLRVHNLRLELGDLDVVNSKTQIYFL